MDDFAINDGRFVFLSSPPKLERISARVVARHLVFDELIRDAENISNRSKCFFLEDWADKHLNKMLSNLPSIAVIRSEMTDQIKFIVMIISCWVTRHAATVFYRSGGWNVPRFVTSDFLPEFVWNSNGEIDYVRTAENLIRGTYLSEEEKFKMACEYCMEDEIDDMYDTYDWLDVDDITDIEEISDNWFVLYWDCKREGLDVDMPEDDDRSVELAILESAPSNESALRYFFSELDDEEKETFANGRMLTLPTSVVKQIVPLYTEVEQRHLFVKNVAEMMENFACEMPVEQCLQFWNFVKRMLRGKQYIKMLSTIFQCPEHIWDSSSSWMAEYTMEIWKTTPTLLKQFIFREQNNNFVLKWNKWYSNTLDENYRLRNDALLLQILSDGGVEYRTQFWRKEWTNLLIEVRPPALRTLLEICLPGTKARDEFKKQIIESKLMEAYLDKLLDGGFIIEVNQFLDILLSEPSQRTDYKKKMRPGLVQLPDRFVRGWTRDDEQIDALGQFINEIKDYDDEDVLECKTHSISSAFCPFIDERYIERRIFNNILYITKRLCGEEKVKSEVRIMYRMFYVLAGDDDEDAEDFKKKMMNAHANRAWRRIMLWAEGSEEKMNELFDKWNIRDPKYETSYDYCVMSEDDDIVGEIE